MTENLVRLSKILSERGICSRREADRYIEDGLIMVDGEVVSTLGIKVSPDANIELLPHAQKKQEGKVTILLNKPVGFVSTQPEKNYRAAIELITQENQYRCANDTGFKHSHLNKLSVAGRLDINSKGLLVFTQDGTLAKQIIGENSGIEKEYLVRVEGEISDSILRRLRSGLSIDDSPLKSAGVDILQDQLLRFVLKEGKKRQIRKMCEMVGLYVVSLKRVRVGNVRLEDLPAGKWRYLSPDESF